MIRNQWVDHFANNQTSRKFNSTRHSNKLILLTSSTAISPASVFQFFISWSSCQRLKVPDLLLSDSVLLSHSLLISASSISFVLLLIVSAMSPEVAGLRLSIAQLPVSECQQLSSLSVFLLPWKKPSFLSSKTPVEPLETHWAHSLSVKRSVPLVGDLTQRTKLQSAGTGIRGAKSPFTQLCESV